MSSVIPPGQADLALRLAQLPQPSKDDCFVNLDELTMAGFNYAASQLGKTVDELAKEAAYMWLRFFFAEAKQAEGLGEEETSSHDLDQ